MSATYRPDRNGMRQLGQSAQMGQAMQQAAEVGKRWAESVSPVDSGQYKESFRVAPTTVRGGRNSERRAGARLANDAPHAIVVESRSNVLARAVNIIEKGDGW